MADATENVVVGVIAKNGVEEVRVALTSYAGHALVDVRTFAEFGDADERRATKKGVSLRLARLPDLIAALQSAGAEARARGFLTEEGSK